MRWFKFVALFILFITPAAGSTGGGFAENPAFCFGFLSAQSQKESDALGPRKRNIRSLFGKFGPKDSTDELGFSEWERIGRDMATDRGDKGHANFLKDCRKLLGAAAKLRVRP